MQADKALTSGLDRRSTAFAQRCRTYVGMASEKYVNAEFWSEVLNRECKGECNIRLPHPLRHRPGIENARATVRHAVARINANSIHI